MKQLIICIAAVALTATAFGQKKDTTAASSKQQAVSVKPLPSSQPQRFVIIGTEADFNFLKKVIADRDNVTPNQTKAALQWIDSKAAIPADSTQKKNK
jgi:hypothetical protein